MALVKLQVLEWAEPREALSSRSPQYPKSSDQTLTQETEDQLPASHHSLSDMRTKYSWGHQETETPWKIVGL